MSDSNDCGDSLRDSTARRKRSKRSLRNFNNPTSPVRLKLKLDLHRKNSALNYFESPISSDTYSEPLSPSDPDTDSSDSYPTLSLNVSIPRYIYDCHGDVSEEDKSDSSESPPTSPNQAAHRQPDGLTARQRAIAGIAESELLELPYYDKPKELTEEMRAKKAEVALQRRLHNQRQQEINKQETIKRLLTRQTHTKKKDSEQKLSRYNPSLSYVSYTSNRDGATLTYPQSLQIDLTPRVAAGLLREPPVCAAPSCSSPSKYRDPSSLLPSCSLACYKKLKLSAAHSRQSQQLVLH